MRIIAYSGVVVGLAGVVANGDVILDSRCIFDSELSAYGDVLTILADCIDSKTTSLFSTKTPSAGQPKQSSRQYSARTVSFVLAFDDRAKNCQVLPVLNAVRCFLRSNDVLQIGNLQPRSEHVEFQCLARQVLVSSRTTRLEDHVDSASARDEIPDRRARQRLRRTVERNAFRNSVDKDSGVQFVQRSRQPCEIASVARRRNVGVRCHSRKPLHACSKCPDQHVLDPVLVQHSHNSLWIERCARHDERQSGNATSLQPREGDLQDSTTGCDRHRRACAIAPSQLRANMSVEH